MGVIDVAADSHTNPGAADRPSDVELTSLRYPMTTVQRGAVAIVVLGACAIAAMVWSRTARVTKASAAIPVYPGARERGGRTRYWPHLLSWDDRSSARVQRVFALSQATSLIDVARHAAPMLAEQGWYLVTPDDLERFLNPQVIVWQREPDERLDLVQLWPLSGMTRTQRLYGGIFPPEFLDAPLVIEWSWALNGPRSSPPALPPHPAVRPPPPPTPPPGVQDHLQQASASDPPMARMPICT